MDGYKIIYKEPDGTAQSFGDNRRSRLALDSGFSRRARLVAGRPNGAPLGDVWACRWPDE